MPAERREGGVGIKTKKQKKKTKKREENKWLINTVLHSQNR